MTTILIVCVNYDSYPELYRYLISIDTAYKRIFNKDVKLKVCIADNSQRKESVRFDSYSFDIEYYAFENLGYFGGASRALDMQPDVDRYDYVIISNVDLIVDENLFNNLPLFPDETLAWISPAILSSYEKRDKGTGLATRPSKIKLKLLTLIYKSPWLLRLFEKTIYRRKSFLQKKNECEKRIYSGHGSFIILTRWFFEIYKRLDYPMFLFGEELFLGELIRLKGLKVVYNPTLKIFDSEHVSTSKMPSRFSCKCQYESISFILRTFYR